MLTPIIRPIISPIITAIISGGTATRLVYDFDGIDDYFTIPQSDLVPGDVVSFTFIAKSVPYTSYEILLTENANFKAAFRIDTDNTYTIGGAYTCTIDGSPVTSGFAAFNDGLQHDVILTALSNTNIGLVGAQWSTVGSSVLRVLSTPLYDLSITAASGDRFYPVNDGWLANPTIADTVSGENGTAVNFNEERWIETNV